MESRLNDNRHLVTYIPFGVLLIIIMALFLSACGKDEAESIVHREDLIGTYFGDTGSVLVLHSDGTADYYKYGDKEVCAGNTWEYENNDLKINIPKYHCEVTGKVEDVKDFRLKSDSPLWDNSDYTQIDKNDNSLSVDECNSIITDNMEIEEPTSTPYTFDGITYQIPAYVSFVGEKDGQAAFQNDDETIQFGFIKKDLEGASASYKTMRDSIIEKEQNIKSEGSITIAGIEGYYVEAENKDEKQAAVIILLQHDGYLDILMGTWKGEVNQDSYLADFYNMIGTATISANDKKDSDSGKDDKENRFQTNSLYSIEDIFFETKVNSIGNIEYHGIVAVKNTSDSNLKFTNLTFDIEDNSGHLLSTDDTVAVFPGIIKPGETAYIYNGIYQQLRSGISSSNGLVLKPSFNVEKTNSTLARYQISDDSYTFNSNGTPDITGRVTNGTSKDASIVEIGALFYDESGRVIGIECDKLYDLLSGQTRSFDISTIMGQADAVKNAKKYSVNAIEYTFVW